MDAVHGMSKSGGWETPPELVTDLATVFDWDWDVCASRANVCKNFYSPEDNGLVQQWRGLCWMNPPYGRKRHIDQWMRSACFYGCDDTAVICLPPARTSTKWWQDNVVHADLVVFIRGRLKFVNRDSGVQESAPFPSALVVFGNITWEQTQKLRSYGMSVFPKMEPVVRYDVLPLFVP